MFANDNWTKFTAGGTDDKEKMIMMMIMMRMRMPTFGSRHEKSWQVAIRKAFCIIKGFSIYIWISCKLSQRGFIHATSEKNPKMGMKKVPKNPNSITNINSGLLLCDKNMIWVWIWIVVFVYACMFFRISMHVFCFKMSAMIRVNSK